MVERGSVLTALAVVVCGSLSIAEAQPKAAPPKQPAPVPVQVTSKQPLLPIGASLVMKLAAESGFVDEVLAFDNQRLAYVVADTSTKSELHVVQFGCTKCIEDKQEIVVDLSPVTLRPIALKLVGQKALVIGATEDGNQVAALVDLSKKAATSTYRLGPAAHITLVTRDGKQTIAVHKTAATKTGVRHTIDLMAIETGKRVTAGKPFELDKDHHKKLDFKVNHWSDGWTRVSGLKGGEWNKKDNQRSPDTEATYDLVSAKFVENKPIADVVEQRKRHQVLADTGGQLEFLRMAWDNSAIHIWSRGVSRSIEIDQPLTNYDAKSLQGVVAADGSAWILLKIDPVNAEAVARKKADPEYVDIFRVNPGEAKAMRKARIPAKDLRFKLGTIGRTEGAAQSTDNYFWLLERQTGFDRGGRNVAVYQLQ
jgi:hypothetical protein